jgi:nucleotide-binding universal stress UspA family protein
VNILVAVDLSDASEAVIAAAGEVAAEYRREHRAVQELANRMRESGIEATPLLIPGPTVETILREAERREAGLIIVGSHGRGAVYDLLVGSHSAGGPPQVHGPVAGGPDARRVRRGMPQHVYDMAEWTPGSL